MRRLVFGLVVIALAVGIQGAAYDWPQFLGPERNGVYHGPALTETWVAGGPRVVWRKSIGQGLSGPVVAQGRVILFHRVANREVVDAFDARTGAAQWRYGYPTAYRDDFGFDEGPRAVPVVADGVMYTFGAEGQLHAVDLATGKRLWSEDTMRRFGVPKGFFGAAGSPLVEDGRVIANIGGRKPASSLSTPRPAKFSGRRPTTTQAIRRRSVRRSRGGFGNFSDARQACGTRSGHRDGAISAGAGAHGMPRRSTPPPPSSIGDQIFVSAQYGPGAGVLRVDGSKLTGLWASDEVLSNHYATSVFHDGYLYGFHGRQEFGPSFRAVEFQHREGQMAQDQFRAGSVLLAGDRLLIMRETGELILAKASPHAFQAVRSRTDPSSNRRAYPALATACSTSATKTRSCVWISRPPAK